jgi:hypothetical protein
MVSCHTNSDLKNCVNNSDKKMRRLLLFLTLTFHDLVATVFPTPVFPIWKLSMLQLSEASTSTINQIKLIGFEKHYATVEAA